MSITTLGNRDNAFNGDSVSGHAYNVSRHETALYNESSRKSGSRAIIGAAVSVGVIATLVTVGLVIVSTKNKTA